jgi:hypothetical protein
MKNWPWQVWFAIRMLAVFILCPVIDVLFNNLVGIKDHSWLDYAIFLPFLLISYYVFVRRWLVRQLAEAPK